MDGPSLRVAASLVVLLGLLGLPVGLLWWQLAPVAELTIRSDGGFYSEAQPQEFVAADGWFAVLTAAVGLVAGLLVWWRVRATPYGVVVGLAVGGGLGAVVAWRTGVWLGRVDLDAVASAPVGTTAALPLALGMRGLLVVEPVLALVGWLAADLLTSRWRAPASSLTASPAVDHRRRVPMSEE